MVSGCVGMLVECEMENLFRSQELREIREMPRVVAVFSYRARVKALAVALLQCAILENEHYQLYQLDHDRLSNSLSDPTRSTMSTTTMKLSLLRLRKHRR